MEVACGEYGDMVPSLVVAVKAYKCEQFQALQKFTNCGKNLADQWRHQEVVNVKETPILDDNISEAEDAPLNCNGARSNKVIVSSQNGKCGVTMCRQVTRPSVILTFCRSLVLVTRHDRLTPNRLSSERSCFSCFFSIFFPSPNFPSFYSYFCAFTPHILPQTSKCRKYQNSVNSAVNIKTLRILPQLFCAKLKTLQS